MSAHPTNTGPEEPPPGEDELLAMAYADGELDAAEAASFAERLRAEPDLLRRVAEHRAIDVLARLSSQPEPAELDWAQLREEASFRGSRALGWVLLAGALAAGALLFGLDFLQDDGVPLPVRLLAAAGGLGLALLFTTVLRRRLRALPLDPYRHVQR